MVRNRNFSILAVLLAAVMVFSMAYVPAAAEAVPAESPKYTAELVYQMNGRDLHTSLSLDLEQMLFTLTYSQVVRGREMDVSLFGSREAVAVQSSLLNQTLGIDLTQAEENFGNSVFAPNSGSWYAMNAQDAQEFLSQLRPGNEAAESETSTVKQYAQLLMDTLSENFEMSMKSETLTIGASAVPTSVIAVTLDTDSLCLAADTLLTQAAQDESLKEALTALCTALSASGQIQLEGDTPENTVDTLFTHVEALSDTLQKTIRDGKYSATVRLNTSKATKSLVRFSLELRKGDDPLVLSFTCNEGRDDFALNLSASGEELLNVTYSITRSDGEALVSQLRCTEGETEVLAADLSWDKTQEHFTCAITRNGERQEYAGQLTLGDDSMTLNLETVNGEPAGTFRLTVRPEADITLPEYTDILTMDEQEIRKVITSLVLSLI